MATAANFFSQVVSALIIVGMFTGLYNPCKAPFVPPAAVEEQAYDGPVLTLIEDNGSDYVIVVGADAGPAERMAAEKLRGFLEQISGVSLEIVEDTAPPREKELIVGSTNRFAMDPELELELGTDGFIIKTVDEKIILSGGKDQPRGTLYSVYDFLEKFLGCRWLGKTVTVIPERETVEVPDAIDEREVPAFIYRQPSTIPRVNGRDGYTREDDVDYSLANRINAKGMIGNSTDEEEYGGIVNWPSGHSAEIILPKYDLKRADGTVWRRGYFEEHPEYFAQGEDGKPLNWNWDSNPCLTHPDVIQIYIDYALEQCRGNPALEGISMGLNDNGEVCQCAGCKAVYAQEPPGAGQTGALMRVLNLVCAELEKEGFTRTTINAFAYGSATYPPNVDLHRNIVIHFCPINMCYMHGPEECEYWENRYYFDEVLAGWKKIAKRICIFEYPLSYNEPGAPYAVWGQLQNYIQFYHRNNVVGLTQCTCSIYDVNFYEMTSYLYARLLWDPWLDLEALYADFLPKFYGGGWQYIREYLRFTAEEAAGRTIRGVTYHTNSLEGCSKLGLLAMTGNELKYVDQLWCKAKELAGSALCLENVRRAELSYRMWKSDTFRGEFWPLNFTFSRTRSNKALYDDFWELLATPKLVEGVLLEEKQIWYNDVDWWVTREDFYNLKVYLLYPKMWSWRQLGRDNEGQVSNVWQLLLKSIF